MELRQLQTFRVVAACLSFTRAAEQLNYAQSSVTAQVRALEQDLGVPLFERLGKRVVLTEAGERLVRYADQLLKLAQEARAQVVMSEEPTGTLLIGAPESLCAYRLPPVLQAFRTRCPQVTVVFKPGCCSATRRAVAEGTLDLAFTLDELLPTPGLVTEDLVDESIWLVTSPDHPLASEGAIGPERLATETMLYTEADCSYRNLFERQLAAAHVHPAGFMEFASIEAIKQCALAGLGVAVLPAMTVQGDIRQGRLCQIPWRPGPLAMVTQMIWHKDKWLSPALMSLITVVRTVVDGLAPANDAP